MSREQQLEEFIEQLLSKFVVRHVDDVWSCIDCLAMGHSAEGVIHEEYCDVTLWETMRPGEVESNADSEG
jgi:hypothetical protein